MSYTTTAALKTYLGIDSDSDEQLLTSLIERAQKAIDTYTQRTFEAASDTTKYFDADADVCGRTLDWTPYGLDLCAITSVVNGDGTTIAASNYTFEPRHYTPYYAIKLKVSNSLIWEYDSNDDPENAIAITGKWAYSTTAPADIVQATIEIASLYYKQRDTNSDLNRTVIAGNATLLPVGLSQMTKDVLRSYKRLV